MSVAALCRIRVAISGAVLIACNTSVPSAEIQRESDTATCLEERGIEVWAVYADEVFEQGERRTVLDLRELSNETIGCAFLAPGRDAELVRASIGPGSLTLRCPAAAAVYFSIPQCCPEGFTCCADGTLLDEESSCTE